MKSVFLSLLFLGLGITVFAAPTSNVEPEYEVTCRMKAKEIAAETYRGCITENKTAQIEMIRREYQDKLKGLKDQYDSEIKKLGVRKADNAKNRPRLPARKVAKRSRPVQQSQDDDVMVEVTNSSGKVITPIDESSMDLPEPIPVEN